MGVRQTKLCSGGLLKWLPVVGEEVADLVGLVVAVGEQSHLGGMLRVPHC